MQYGNVADALTFQEWLLTMNPFIFSGLGVGCAMAVSASGAAWGIALVGSALVGHSVARPHVRTRNIVRYADGLRVNY